MKVKRIDLRLPTRELKSTLEFYVSKLAFRKLYDFQAYCTVSFGSLNVSFIPVKSIELVRAYQTDYSIFSLNMDGIHGYFEEVKKSGVAFNQELELMAPGVWQFSLRDNNGYLIGFAEPGSHFRRQKRRFLNP